MHTNTVSSVLSLTVVLLASGAVQAATPRGPDFDSDGYDDAAVGVPSEDVGSLYDAGAVNLLYGSPTGPTTKPGFIDTLWEDLAGVEGASKDMGNYGHSLAWGDLDGDCYDDLVIGVRGAGPGALSVFYGGSMGLSVDHEERIELGTFVWDVAAGDYNGDGLADVAVGTLEAVGDGEGAVHVFYGGSDGLAAANPPRGALLHRAIGTIPGEPTDDGFATALVSGDLDCDGRDDLAIAAPRAELMQQYANAGSVVVVYGSDAGLTGAASVELTQGGAAHGVPAYNALFGGDLAAGNFNGDTAIVDGVAIECVDLAVTVNGGVQVFFGTHDAGIQATAPDDRLFAAGDLVPADERVAQLSIGRVNSDSFDDLVLGTMLEDLVDEYDSIGAIVLLPGSTSGPLAAKRVRWTQDTLNVTDTAEIGDHFGAATVFGWYRGPAAPGGLIVGAPYEDVGGVPNVGLVNSIALANTATPATASGGKHWWHGNIGSQQSEANDNFGGVMATTRKADRCWID